MGAQQIQVAAGGSGSTGRGGWPRGPCLVRSKRCVARPPPAVTCGGAGVADGERLPRGDGAAGPQEDAGSHGVGREEGAQRQGVAIRTGGQRGCVEVLAPQSTRGQMDPPGPQAEHSAQGSSGEVTHAGATPAYRIRHALTQDHNQIAAGL